MGLVEAHKLTRTSMLIKKKKKNKAITLLNTATLQHHHKNPRSFDKKDESIQEVKSFHNIVVN
jgi:hypothetical protein